MQQRNKEEKRKKIEKKRIDLDTKGVDRLLSMHARRPLLDLFYFFKF